MKKVFKMLVLLLVMALSVTFVACKKDDLKEIGIVQYVSATALDEARKGILEGLKDGGFIEGENVNITVYNPQADPSTLAQVVETAVRKCDLIFAIATPAAIAVKNECEKQGKTTPVVFTAVTDPVDAGLVKTNEKPGTIATGTNDMNPVAKQIDLIKEILPEAKKVGIIYTASEPNSETQVALARAEASIIGLEVVVKTITSGNEIQTMAMALINEDVDAIYVPTDNTVAAGITAVTAEAVKNGVLTVCGEEGQLKTQEGGSTNGIVALGINYFNLGKITGEMACKILKGEANAETMPVQSLTDFALVINNKAALDSGITIPSTLLDKATLLTFDK